MSHHTESGKRRRNEKPSESRRLESWRRPDDFQNQPEPRRFVDRFEAGRTLAGRLMRYADQPDVLILALPRGGVPVAYEVAHELDAPLDIFLVRKLGVPGHEELAMGALATGPNDEPVRVINQQVVSALGIPDRVIDDVALAEQQELIRRERAYRAGRPPLDVRNRTIILIDDGLATGSTMRAAAAAIKQQHPRRLIVAVPVAARETCEELRQEVDEVVCAVTPEPFQAVGLWYDDFAQTTDDEVQELLTQATGADCCRTAPRTDAAHQQR